MDFPARNHFGGMEAVPGRADTAAIPCRGETLSAALAVGHIYKASI